MASLTDRARNDLNVLKGRKTEIKPKQKVKYIYTPLVAYETKVPETGRKRRKHIVGTNRIKPVQQSEKKSPKLE